MFGIDFWLGAMFASGVWLIGWWVRDRVHAR